MQVQADVHLLSGAGGLLSSQASVCECRRSAELLCMSERSCCLLQAVTTLEGNDSGAHLSPAASPAHICCSSHLAAGSACGEPGLLPGWQLLPSVKDHFCAPLHINAVRLLWCQQHSPTILSQHAVPSGAARAAGGQCLQCCLPCPCALQRLGTALR